jgi:uncharacterized protein
MVSGSGDGAGAGKNSTTITLLGRDQARTGNRFIYGGPLQECRECQLKNICFNLKKGRRYRVVNVRDKDHQCKVYSDGVKVVEVEQVPFRAGVPKTMVVVGSVITFHPMGCGIFGCHNWNLTHPTALDDGTRIKVISITGEQSCENGTTFLDALVDFAE